MKEVKQDKLGTVGAVALDQNGNLAAGTSTGGMTNKRYGRIGDVQRLARFPEIAHQFQRVQQAPGIAARIQQQGIVFVDDDFCLGAETVDLIGGSVVRRGLCRDHGRHEHADKPEQKQWGDKQVVHHLRPREISRQQ